ncbi:MAG: hypothetical protein HFG09_03690 [Oscillibacter sp.]|nr:hypothetical protein [Oscillibacter sp.]
MKLQLSTVPEAQTEYANIVSKLFSGVSLDDVLSDTFSYTGNLFVGIDLSGKILAYSSPFYIDYPVWMDSIKQGYCSEILMDYIQARRRHIHVPKGQPIPELYCKKSKMHILVTRICNNNTTLGYFFALNRKPSFDNYTRKVLPLFAQRAKENILRLINMNEADDYRSIIQTNILLDAANGASPLETQLRTKFSGLKFQKSMRVLAIRTPYSNKPDFYTQVLVPELRNALREQPCFPWHSSIVCLVGSGNGASSEEHQREELSALAAQYNLQIGISNVFTDISRFSDYFEQAQTALTFANRVTSETPFFYYLDYVLYILLDRVSNDKLLASGCHPALEQLRIYDEKKGMELFETLRAYTEAGFNKARAAQMIFIHRNTINYRIRQIEQLCNIDLSNEKLLFTLQLSFRLYSYRENHLIGSG